MPYNLPYSCNLSRRAFSYMIIWSPFLDYMNALTISLSNNIWLIINILQLITSTLILKKTRAQAWELTKIHPHSSVVRMVPGLVWFMASTSHTDKARTQFRGQDKPTTVVNKWCGWDHPVLGKEAGHMDGSCAMPLVLWAWELSSFYCLL